MTRPDRQAQWALFDREVEVPSDRANLLLEPGAVVLRAFAMQEAPALLAAIEGITHA